MNILPTWLWTAKGSAEDKDGSQQDIEVAQPGDRRTTDAQGTIREETLNEKGDGEDVRDDSTPKALPSGIDAAVPSFNLDDSHTTSPGVTPPTENTTSGGDSGSVDSAQKSLSTKSAMRSATKPQSSLMLPPSMKAPTLRTPPTTTGGLRPPTNGPLPNRGPPQSQAAQARSSLAPSVKTPNARQKVILKPGHSPLDWASLSQSSNLSGVPGFQRVTPSMLKEHNGRKGRPAWSSYLGKVYNITPYVHFHPGGEGELLRAAGKDGAKLFMEVHSWINWENMLNSCIVGIMVSEAEGEGLDEMD